MVWKRLTSILSTAALSLVLVTQAIAAVPWNKSSYFQNWGGLNDNVSTLEIADGEATDIQNIVFDTGGALNKRYGFNNITAPNQAFKVDANGTGVTGVWFYKKANGNKFLVSVVNVNGTAKIYEKQYDASGFVPQGAWTSIDAGIFPSNYTNDNLVSFSVAQDQLVMTIPASSQSKPFTWTGSGNVTTLTADANCPNATIDVFHKNILFLAGDSANPSRITFSDLTNGITKYIATDFFDLDKNNGQKITGMVSAFGNLYIFEDNSIWMLTGSTRDDFNLQKMVDNIGTISHQSISIVNNTIVFITKQNDIGIYDGNFSVKFISSKIRNTIGGNNFNRAGQALGIGFSSYRYKDLDYYAAESQVGIGTNNQVLLFDTFRQAWTKIQGFTPDSWTVAESSSGQNVLVWGDYNGFVYYYPNIGVYNDVSNSCSSGVSCTTSSPAINTFYQTKWFRYPDVALGDKYLRVFKTYILNDNNSSLLQTEIRSDYASSGNIYTFNFSSSGALWGVAQWGVDKWAGGGLNIDREEPNLGKQMFQIKYSNNQTSQNMTILGFETFVEGSDRI